MALATGSKIQIITNHPGKCGISIPPYTSLNTAAIIQIAAIINDTMIRETEKLYSFSGLKIS